MKDGDVPVYGAARAPSVTSSSLLAQVTQADAQAWGRLVQLYGPMVYGWCRRTGLQAEDAHDMVQEVFKSFFTAITTFRRDRPQGRFSIVAQDGYSQ
jgi:RNA polymerase sigma-70 factor (ECF subfamily)